MLHFIIGTLEVTIEKIKIPIGIKIFNGYTWTPDEPLLKFKLLDLPVWSYGCKDESNVDNTAKSENEIPEFVYTPHTYQNIPSIIYDVGSLYHGISWNYANAYCSVLVGTQLATMNDAPTYHGILQLMENTDTRGICMIGLNDKNNDNIYTWISDDSVYDSSRGYGWSDLSTTLGGGGVIDKDCVYFYNPTDASLMYYGMVDIGCDDGRVAHFACDLPNIHEYVNHYIGVYLYNNTKNMYEANEYCNKTFGTELATILTSNDNIDAYNSVNNIKNMNQYYNFNQAWIGITDISSGTDFIWQDERDSYDTGYTNWYVHISTVQH